LLVSAADPAALIEGVLVPLQQGVGELWELSLLDVVEEHAMTAIVEELLSAIMFHAPRRTDRGRLILACPYGEWHTLPARMAGELLQMHGWSVTFSGASTPSATLAAFVRSHRPLAVVLSCTMATGLMSARDAIEVLHEQHVPVLVGGPGFGPDDRRAHALGADGWARSVSDADHMLASWSRDGPTLNTASGSPYAMLSSSDSADAVDAALRRLDLRVQQTGSQDAIGVTARDLSTMLDVVNVGLLTEDPRVVSDLVAWYRRTFAAHRLPPETIDLVVESLAETLPTTARSLLSPLPGDVESTAS
jgi:methanogenic corrinoid protein MtbC1